MLEKQQKKKKEKKVHAVLYQVGFILILYGENNGNYISVTNHFTAGAIIEFQAEITVYCDTCTRETIQ